jgi:ParB-like chromosome segregation protein Spo0J
MERKQIALSIIKLDGGTQSRAEINQALVEEYADFIAAGAVFPAVRIFTNGIDYYLADGFHRYFAHQKAGKSTIEADVENGTQREAIWYSLSANTKHGNRPTNADKRKAVMTVLEDFEWCEYSDAEIARHCGVSPKTVAAYRTHKPEVRKFITPSGNVAEKRAAHQKEPVAQETVQVKVDDVPVALEDSHMDAMVQELVTENQALNDRLAVVAMDATEDEKGAAKSLIDELREEIRLLTIELTAVKISRDSYQRENSQLKKQCVMYQKQLKKA